MKDPSGYYSRRPKGTLHLIDGHKAHEEEVEAYRVHKLTDKEARCLDCPLPVFNIRACSKCPFDAPQKDPCLSCRSRGICESYHGTCNEKARWSGAQSRR